ncbi:MAG: hypothetical protein FJW61_03530 [Actinobacteria bacterium]|nr:hypothetical protein [Actinomycetota bacterium]
MLGKKEITKMKKIFRRLLPIAVPVVFIFGCRSFLIIIDVVKLSGIAVRQLTDGQTGKNPHRYASNI